MNARLVLAGLGAPILVLACATTATAQPTCAPTTCANYFDDQVEVELVAPLNPDDALTVPRLRALPGMAPLADLLTLSHARLEPSVPANLARQLKLTRFYTIRFPALLPPITGNARAALIRGLRGLPAGVIRRAAPVPKPSPPTDDPYVGSGRTPSFGPASPCGSQWYLRSTGVDTAWTCGATGKGIVVADIDWGFETNHAELVKALDMKHSYNACAPTKPIQSNEYSFHGTGTAGLIAAGQNGEGIQGLAYESTIWPLQASCSTTKHQSCDENWVKGNPWAAAIAEATSDTCDGCRKVLLLEAQTCCQGSYEASIAVQGAIRAAIDNRIVVVVAAGNGDRDAACDDSGSPIPETGAIVVGATAYGDDNPRNSLSNFGSRILVSAPGADHQDLTATTNDRKCDPSQADLKGYTRDFGGTSGAAAKVAAVVALMLQKNPKLLPEEVKEILKSTGGTVNTDPGKPMGVFLNAGAAIRKIDPKCAAEQQQNVP